MFDARITCKSPSTLCFDRGACFMFCGRIPHAMSCHAGGKTDQNAHPHMDYGNRIALVHNGTINNAHELRRELEGKGITFK